MEPLLQRRAISEIGSKHTAQKSKYIHTYSLAYVHASLESHNARFDTIVPFEGEKILGQTALKSGSKR